MELLNLLSQGKKKSNDLQPNRCTPGRATSCSRPSTRPLLSGGGGAQGGFLVRSLVDGTGSYSVAHTVGLLPTELIGMWGWILLRSSHQGRGSPPAPAPTKQRPAEYMRCLAVRMNHPQSRFMSGRPQTSTDPCNRQGTPSQFKRQASKGPGHVLARPAFLASAERFV